MDFWNTATVNPDAAPPEPTEQELAVNLGKHSQFVGLMDTAAKVQAHLDAIRQYEAVRRSALADMGVEEPQPAPEQPWVDCGQCESPYGACVAQCAKGVPLWNMGKEMDAALAADQAKLEGLGAFDELSPESQEYYRELAQQPQAERHSIFFGEPTATPQRCTLGAGCDEAGVCYAAAHGQPDQCGAPQAGSQAGPQLATGAAPQGNPSPAPAAQRQRQPSEHAQAVAEARQRWRNAIAERDAWLAQWNAYVRHLHEEFKQLRDLGK